MRRAARLFAALCIVGGSACVLLGVRVLPPGRKRTRAAQSVLRRSARSVLMALGIRLDVRGPSPRGPALLAGNHLSWLDVVCAIASWRCTFVAKAEVRRWPIIGSLSAALDVVFVDRTRRRDLLRAIPALEDALRAGHCVLLFPEGTTTLGQGVGPFRSALFEAAVRADAPVVPVTFGGAGTDAHGPAVCWVGEETLLANVWRLAGTRCASVSVWVGAAVAPGVDRKLLAQSTRTQVVRRFAPVRGDAPDALAHPRDSPRFSRAVSALRSMALALLMVPLVAIGAGYAVTPILRFPTPRAFTGAQWYNPYDGIDGLRDRSLLANFHAHSSAWRGVTRGRHTRPEVVQAYRNRGYDVVGVSDYHTAPETSHAAAFPVYEHGWNARKAHHLVFAPARVVWLDFPFAQTLHQQQRVLDALASSSPLVAIAHPRLRNGHTPAALRSLTNYDLLEVLNRYSAPADEEWDAVLSSGHAIWLLASDDAHDAHNPTQVGVNATRIFATSRDERVVLAALRAGRAYGVHRADGDHPLQLRSMSMRGDTLHVQVDGAPDTVRVTGQNGRVRALVSGATARAGTLSVVAAADDGYLRVVATQGASMLYTNPVVRWNGRELPLMLAVTDWPRTVLWRSGWMLVVAWRVSRMLAPRRRRVRTPRSAGASASATSLLAQWSGD